MRTVPLSRSSNFKGGELGEEAGMTGQREASLTQQHLQPTKPVLLGGARRADLDDAARMATGEAFSSWLGMAPTPLVSVANRLSR